MAASSASRNSASTRLSVGTAMLQKSRWQTIQRQKWNSSQLTWMSCSLRPWPAAANHRLSKDIAKIGACDPWWPKNLRSFSETGKARNAESSSKKSVGERTQLRSFVGTLKAHGPWHDGGIMQKRCGISDKKRGRFQIWSSHGDLVGITMEVLMGIDGNFMNHMEYVRISKVVPQFGIAKLVYISNNC